MTRSCSLGSIPSCLAGSVLLALFGLGCSGNDSSSAPPVSFATFNTALVAQAENVEARLEATGRDLPKLNADVVCLQEVWQPEHVDALVEALKDDYPYAHWSAKASEASYGCNQTETDSLIGCIDAKCANVASSGMALCAAANCANEYAAVSKGCQKCVLDNQTLSPATIATNCQSVDPNATAYENQNGLVLLSKNALKSKDLLVLKSSFGDRGVLFARVETELLPTVDLFCTHLAATLGEVTYAGPYGSWSGERAVQINELAEFMQVKQQSDQVGVVMGDMNCGPEADGVVGEDAAGFESLLEIGLDVPYLEGNDLGCTFCSSNTVTGGNTPDVMIDHVLFSELPKAHVLKSQRVLDKPITVKVDGQNVETYHSDHFGVMVTVSE
jgi:endonuclease/exonuclease/phosphatase family metal-dependent hydrolase